MDTLILENEAGIVTITLNRPDKLNAINALLLQELEEVVAQVTADPTIRCVVITGAGSKAFAAGADIAELHEQTAETGRAFALRGQRVFTAIERLDKPVIGAVNGFALGGGCELAMACHLRFASSKARLGLPEISLGILPGYGGTQRMPRLIGAAKALEYILSCDMIDAPTALQLGLVNRVLEPEKLLSATMEFARMITTRPVNSVAAVLRSVSAASMQIDAGQSLEAEIFGELCGLQDFAEGTLAFLEKRPATFTGS